MLPEIVQIQPRALDANDADHVAPLAVRDRMALPVPPKLLQQDVLWWMDVDCHSRADRHWLATSQLLRVERRAACHEQIHLQRGRLVDEVGAPAAAHRAPARFIVDIELPGYGPNQGRNVTLLESGDDVDIDCGTRLTRKRAWDGTADRVGEPES